MRGHHGKTVVVESCGRKSGGDSREVVAEQDGDSSEGFMSSPIIMAGKKLVKYAEETR